MFDATANQTVAGAASAYAINVRSGVTVDGAGNSVQLFDTTSGTLKTLDSSASFYAGLTGAATPRRWRS